MPSELTDLRLVTLCNYLTDTGCQWRPADWTAMKMVKALKGETINGFFEVNVSGTTRKFDQSNASEFVEIVPKAMARVILDRIPEPATLVPIPNSSITAATDPAFKTLALAQGIARASTGRFKVVPALVFKAKQIPSRKGGPRSPFYFEGAYKVAQKIEGPIVLVDDVCTTGAHFVGATWLLQSLSCDLHLACAFGRSTKEQAEKPIGVHEQILSLAKDVPKLL